MIHVFKLNNAIYVSLFTLLFIYSVHFKLMLLLKLKHKLILLMLNQRQIKTARDLKIFCFCLYHFLEVFIFNLFFILDKPNLEFRHDKFRVWT